MNVKRQSNDTVICLDKGMVLGKGAEGTVYKIPSDRSLVAKIYPCEKLNDEKLRELRRQADKLRVMLDNAPSDPMRPDHCSIAWPVDLLLSTDGSDMVVGFLMPGLVGMDPISSYYYFPSRHLKCPLFRYDHLCRTATNLASAVSALHDSGYIIGDVNNLNILVGDTALVTLIDTDSFQVTDPKDGQVYRCPVGTGLFTPPELQGKTFRDVGRVREHDLFGIAVLFFQLLMEGTQPFARIFSENEEAIPYEECIVKGNFPYARSPQCAPPKLALPFETLPPELRDLFARCFEDGHLDPKLRPDARTWHKALKEAEKSITTCGANDQHRYFSHCPNCPWCERARRFQSPGLPGWDPFPSKHQAKSFAQVNHSVRQSAATQPAPMPTATAQAQHPPQPASFFFATPAKITVGQSTTLQWYVPNAQRITISDNTGKLINTGNSPHGTAIVYPGKNTIYLIQAWGLGVKVPSSLHVSVSLPQVPVSLNAINGLNQPSSLNAAAVRLGALLLLKGQLVRLYYQTKLRTYMTLGMPKRLDTVPTNLRNYLPLARPAHFGFPNTQVESNITSAGMANKAKVPL